MIVKDGDGLLWFISQCAFTSSLPVHVVHPSWSSSMAFSNCANRSACGARSIIWDSVFQYDSWAHQQPYTTGIWINWITPMCIDSRFSGLMAILFGISPIRFCYFLNDLKYNYIIQKFDFNYYRLAHVKVLNLFNSIFLAKFVILLKLRTITNSKSPLQSYLFRMVYLPLKISFVLLIELVYPSR